MWQRTDEEDAMGFFEFLGIIYAVLALREFALQCITAGQTLERLPWLAGFHRRDMVLLAALFALIWPVFLVGRLYYAFANIWKNSAAPS